MTIKHRTTLPARAGVSAAGLLLAVLSPLAGGRAAAAPAEAATEQVRARLVASVDAVYPGAEVLLGVNQRIIPHWHTYWKNPGDSGLPTTIAWHLPPGASAGEIQWPVPSRFSLGPVTNYAYADEVTLLTAIKVPEDLRPGASFPVAATVKWLVCEEICLPQEAELGLDLPVAADRSGAGPGSPLIRAARATLPVASPWPVTVDYGGDGIALRVGGPELKTDRVTEVSFFPEQWGRISHGAVQTRLPADDGIVLKLQPGEAPAAAGESLPGVLVVTESGAEGTVTRGFAAEARPLAAGIQTPLTAAPGPGLPSALLLALLGGVLLNLMPCVFPVLSLKALHLLHQAREDGRRTRLQGLAYTAGVLASFGLLGILLIVLKAGGAAVGWGFQFQSPLFVLAVAYLMFAVGLSLSGVVAVGGSVAGLGASLAERSGYSGSFFTGVLAAVVAAPCTAPFMGAAVGYALTQPPAVLLAVLAALGFGLALPYLLLSHWPFLQRRLPRPGRWMETLKQGLAFPMYGTAAWLVWILARQAGPDLAAVALAGMVAIAFAAWIFERTRPGGLPLRRAGAGLAGAALALALAGGYLGVPETSAGPGPAAGSAADRNWEPYSPDRLQALRARGEPVFLNFTAAWCISCLVNERVALNDDSVTAAFRKAGITYLKGDWTQRDPLITAKLAEFGRSGVPLYVHYPAGAGAEPVVLPQILTPDIVLTAIAPAAGSGHSSFAFKE
jgi:thiol:disulfide interchange protein/DsbC/DsbD-like thiol-disulfide interchange protein